MFKNADKKGVEHTPGWSIPALEYLSRMRQVAAIGHETLNTDSGVESAETGFLVAQQYWIMEDKYQIELMANLDQVPAVGMPHIKDSPGISAEVFAVIPEE